MVRRMVGLVLAVVCLGCATAISVTPLAGVTPARPALCAAAVKLFASPTGVGTGYTELAILSASRRGADQQGLIVPLEAKAATLGAEWPHHWEFENASKMVGVQATAIWIPSDSTSARTPCEPRGQGR